MFHKTTVKQPRITSGANSDGMVATAQSANRAQSTLSSSKSSLTNTGVMSTLRQKMAFILPILFLVSNISVFEFMRLFGEAFTLQFAGLAPYDYLVNTGPSGLYTYAMVVWCSLGFWRGWVDRDAPVQSRARQIIVPLLLASILSMTNIAFLPPVVMFFVLRWFGNAVSKGVPATMFNSAWTASVLSVLIAAGSWQWVNTFYLSTEVTINTAIVSLIALAGVSMLSPLIMIRRSSCRDPKAGAQFGLLVQTPLLIAGVSYTAFSAIIALLHSVANPALSDWMMAMGYGSIIGASLPLWVKAGCIAMVTVGCAASAGLGGALAVHLNNRAFKRLTSKSM